MPPISTGYAGHFEPSRLAAARQRWEQNMTRLTAGFTLVEAAIMLTVVGFCLSVALPAYREYKLREEVELVIRAAASAKLVVEEFARTHAVLPDSAAISLPFPTLARVRSTVWTGSSQLGAITISTTSGAKDGLGELDSKAIVLQASYNPVSKQVHWTCGRTQATTVSHRYLPGDCK